MLCIPVLTVAFIDASAAQTILKKKPNVGMLHPGETVLADDGSRPKGTIKQMIGGSNRKFGTDGVRPGAPRQHHRIPRP
jgi:hypothetical protein